MLHTVNMVLTVIDFSNFSFCTHFRTAAHLFTVIRTQSASGLVNSRFENVRFKDIHRVPAVCMQSSLKYFKRGAGGQAHTAGLERDELCLSRRRSANAAMTGYTRG